MYTENIYIDRATILSCVSAVVDAVIADEELTEAQTALLPVVTCGLATADTDTISALMAVALQTDIATPEVLASMLGRNYRLAIALSVTAASLESLGYPLIQRPEFAVAAQHFVNIATPKELATAYARMQYLRHVPDQNLALVSLAPSRIALRDSAFFDMTQRAYDIVGGEAAKAEILITALSE